MATKDAGRMGSIWEHHDRGGSRFLTLSMAEIDQTGRPIGPVHMIVINSPEAFRAFMADGARNAKLVWPELRGEEVH